MVATNMTIPPPFKLKPRKRTITPLFATLEDQQNLVNTATTVNCSFVPIFSPISSRDAGFYHALHRSVLPTPLCVSWDEEADNERGFLSIATPVDPKRGKACKSPPRLPKLQKIGTTMWHNAISKISQSEFCCQCCCPFK